MDRDVRTLRVAFIAGTALASALAMAALAFAQPKGRSAHKAVEDAGAPPASTAAAPTAVDAGPVAVQVAEETADGGKLSPLNPAPNEFSDAGASGNTVDYDRLLADIASLRARVAAVSDTLFHSRIGISVESRGDHGRIASLTVSLDDGIVWTSPASYRAGDLTLVYDHAVAPGHHAVTVDVERRDERNDTFRSAQRSRFIVDVPTDQRLSVELRLDDDSNMGGDFPAERKGQYELRIRARAESQPTGRR